MKQSLTFYLTHLVIKLKGLKKNFSQDPINYKNLRKEDVFKPKGSFFEKNVTKQFKILDSEITEIVKKNTSNKLLLFVHGGAFVFGPGQHHWDTIKEIGRKTDYTIWLCNYPKAPEYKIIEISSNIDAVYSFALKQFNPSQITLIGDSVGGTLITALTQRLIIANKQMPIKLILVSPVMDASMSNNEIDKVDKKDPVLSKVGLLSAKKMSAGNTALKDVMISPLYGSFDKFPETILYLAESDITYPDQKLAVEKFKLAKVKIKIILGENMPHIWPLLPIMKEAKLSLDEIIGILNKE